MVNILVYGEHDATIKIDRKEYLADQQLLDFFFDVLTWGMRDVRVAIERVNEACLDTSDFAKAVVGWAKDTETPLSDVDVAALALDWIAGEAGAEELNEYLYCNYLDSRFTADPAEAGAILYAVDEADRGDAWQWLVDFTNAEAPTDEDEEA